MDGTGAPERRVSDLVPRPDPTVLTTEQLQRAIEALKELLQQSITSEIRVMSTRFDGIDEWRGTHEAQRVELKADTKEALRDAFAAAKELVRQQTDANDKAAAKTEDNFAKLIEAQGKKTDSDIKGLADAVADMKERLVKAEGDLKTEAKSNSAVKDTKAEGMGYLFAALSLIVAVVAIVLTLTS